MDNPFTPSRVVTGESFCNRRKELKELSYYVQNNQTVLLYSHRRTGKTSLIFELMGKLNEFIILWDSLTPNQRKALRLLAKTEGQAMFYSESLQRFGFRSGSLLSKALSTLSKRDIVTKNKIYHIQNAMLKKWILSTLSV